MDRLKTGIAAAAVALSATSAFADTCYPVGNVTYTNDEGVSTTVYAVIDEPINFESEKSTGLYIPPEDAKINAEAEKGRNLSINSMMALIMNDQLRETFGGEAGPGLAAHLVGPGTLCVNERVVQEIKENGLRIMNTGISYEGDEGNVSIWTLSR